MSVAIYIVTRGNDHGIDTFVDGKAVGSADQALLDRLCQSAGIAPVLDYVSENPDELAEFFGEESGDVLQAEELPEERWFTPIEGREWAEKLLAVLVADSTGIADAEGLADDLRDYVRVFSELEAAGVEWHFSIDL